MRCRLTFPPWVLAALVSLTAGCSYIHFGRIEKIRGDSALVAENYDLRVQKKLLQEELAIAGRERAALQKTLENASAAPDATTRDLVAQLTNTHQELDALRASYAQLERERKEHAAKQPPRQAAPNPPVSSPELAGLREQLATTETKLAESMRTYSTLQAENQQLRAAVEQAHAENAQLLAKVQELTANNTEAHAALDQLNASLAAQKQARADAEQTARELQTKVEEITLHPPAPAAAPVPTVSAVATTPIPTPEPRISLAEARESAAEPARQLSAGGKLPLAGTSSAIIVLSTRPDKSASSTPPAVPPPEKPARTYTVREGDSLEKIAQQLYGRRDRWILLYTANNALLSDGKPLKAGMTLQVPEEE